MDGGLVLLEGWRETHHGDILYNKHFRDKAQTGWETTRSVQKRKTWCIAHELGGNTDGPGMIIRRIWKEKGNVAAGDGERGESTEQRDHGRHWTARAIE